MATATNGKLEYVILNVSFQVRSVPFSLAVIDRIQAIAPRPVAAHFEGPLLRLAQGALSDHRR